MTVFETYAQYYDLLYQDKDYEAEADYVSGLIRKYSPHAASILELGSGTGRHASILAHKGFKIHGVERSEEMLKRARSTVSSDRVTFSEGDIRTVRLGQQFDAVISLFHVMSYQTTNEDLMAAFETATVHLKPGAPFIFDCWYGPAVLTNQPGCRIKRIKSAELDLIRFVEPEMLPNENAVNVHYLVIARDLRKGSVNEIRETHRMRYLFQLEIEYMLQQSGFRFVAGEEWITSKDLGLDTWNACFVVEKPAT